MRFPKRKNKKNKRTETPQPTVVDIETIINELATQPPKAMEKIISLAKARREYNQRLRALQQSIDNAPADDDTPESAEAALEALDSNRYQGLDDKIAGDYAFIETTTGVPDEPTKSKSKKKEKDS